MTLGYDPEAIYQDADIEAVEATNAEPNPNDWKCDYLNCNREARFKGVCEQHHRTEQREML